jgi:outer membrane protein TolC
MTRVFVFVSVLLAAWLVFPAMAAEPLRLEQVLARVLATYPSLQVAALQLERARLEQVRVESTLGWNLGAQAGVARDTGLFGGTVDRTDAGASLNRALKSGGTVGLQGSYATEDSTTTISPLLPNPLDTGRVDLSYRQPWGRGADNPEYAQGLRSAQAGVIVADASEQALRDQIARQTADLYYAAALTQARFASAQAAIARAERLLKYTRANTSLGLTETKDVLQAEAQLRTQLAEQDALQTAWAQQRTTLNRLMGREWDIEFQPVVQATPVAADLPAVWSEALAYSPELKRAQARIELAEAAIERARDARRDRLDLVYSVGSRSRSGDTLAGTSVSEADVVGGVRAEYSRALDRRGADATLTQAHLDRDAARAEQRLIEEDVRYNAASLLAEIHAARVAFDSARARLVAEEKKLDEAQQRYRRGRTDTARIIDFERELSAAQLAVEQQRIEFARRRTALDVLRGAFWNAVAREGTP